MKKLKQIITMQISSDLLKQLQTSAKQDSRSVSNWINCAIIDKLKKEGGNK